MRKDERSAERAGPGRPAAPAFWLGGTVAAGVLAVLAVGVLTGDVLGHHGLARADPHVTAWLVAHRTGWLSSILKVVTWLGSLAVIIPAGLIAGAYFVLRWHRWWPVALLAVTIGGAVGWYHLVKYLVGRPRPPPAIWIGHFSGASFPSGHATQSVACYATLALIVTAGRPPRIKIAACGLALLIVLVVGASRVYLGAHWLTDVLGGYALGVAWVAAVLAVTLTAWPARWPRRPPWWPRRAGTAAAGRPASRGRPRPG